MKKGISTTQIIILISFVFLISLAGYFFYNQRFNNNKEFNLAYQSLFLDIETLSKSAKGNPTPKDPNCKKLQGYTLITKYGDFYRLSEWCSNGYFVIKDVGIDTANVSVTSTFPSTTFKLDGKGTNLADPNIIKIESIGNGAVKNITINIDGSISKQ